MVRRQRTPAQIINEFREAEAALAPGQSLAQICKALGITEQTYDRRRNECGGLPFRPGPTWDIDGRGDVGRRVPQALGFDLRMYVQLQQHPLDARLCAADHRMQARNWLPTYVA